MKSPYPSTGRLPSVLAPNAAPDITALITELHDAVNGTTWFQQSMRANEETRDCYWPGQRPDGRKHGTPTMAAKPWENAADHRVHLVTEVIKERTAIRQRAITTANVSVRGRNVEDIRKGSLLAKVVRYYLSQVQIWQADETKYLSNWSQNDGHAVLYCGWRTRKQMEIREMARAEMLVTMLTAEVARLQAELGGQELDEEQLAELQRLQMIALEEQFMAEGISETLVALVLQMVPELVAMGPLGRKEARRLVKELKQAEKAEYAVTDIKEAGLEWEALRAMVDVFYPSQTKKLRDARWIARARWMSEVELRAWAEEEDFDSTWLNEVLSKPGRALELNNVSDWVLGTSGTRFRNRVQVGFNDEDTKYYQIFEVYWKASNTVGVPVLYRSIVHGKVQKFAKHEVCRAYHGEYPFLELREEYDSKALLSSRGVPEVIGTYQSAIKVQWDSRSDAAALHNLPEMVIPIGAAVPTHRGPGTFMFANRGGVDPFKPLQPPTPDNRSVEIEGKIEARVGRLYGRMHPDVPEVLTMLFQQTLGNDTLELLQRLVRLSTTLIQQYSPPLTSARIAGTDEYVTMQDREEIQGQFDIETRWDSRDLNLEWVSQKLGFYKDMLLPLDNRGSVNREVLLRMAADAIDPTMADRIVPDEGQTQKREMDEEDAALSMIFTGGLPAFVTGVDHAGRAERMQTDLAQSPVRQQIMAANPQIRAVWEDRLQKHLFQGEQQTNKRVGIEGGSDPLRQSPLARLKQGGYQAMIGQGDMNSGEVAA